MYNNYRLLTAVLAAFLLLPLLASAQGEPKTDARILVNQYLTEKAAKNPQKAVQTEFRIGDDIMEAHETRSVYVQQTQNDIDLRGAVMGLFVTKDGRTLTNDDLTKQNAKVNTSAPTLTAEQALRVAMDAKGGFPLVAALEVKEAGNDAAMTSVFDKGDIAGGDFKARLIYLPTKFQGHTFRLAWETQCFTKDRQHYWLTFVDAVNGDVLDSQDLVLHCSFGGVEYDHSEEEHATHAHNQHLMHLEAAESMEDAMEAARQEVAVPLAEMPFVMSAAAAGPDHSFLALPFPADSPDDGVQEMVNVSDGDNVVASAYGWTSTDGATETNLTKGNNVYAFYDPSPGPLGGVPTGGTPPNSAPGVSPATWNYPWDLTEDPEYTSGASFPNRDAAIVNLFYANNMMHDIFYQFGFDEKHRNFQNTNIINGVDRGGAPGNGKKGGDEVLAQAQDGGGTNNANMLTLADGTNGQMQMYLWTSVEPGNLVKVDFDGDSGGLPGPTALGNGYEAEYAALQGSFANAPTANVNLHTNPQTAEFIIINESGIDNSDCSAAGTSTGTTACGTTAPQAGAGLPPCNDISGKIVIIDRGDCSFVEKINGAEQNGTGLPAGIIIVNNDQVNPDDVISMGGTDVSGNTIRTPTVMISFNDGAALKAAVRAAAANGETINGELRRDVAPAPRRDGDFDNGVIAHEYGHGISTRSSIRTDTGLGQLSGAEQGGEGWSDFWGLYITMTNADLQAPTTQHPYGVLPTRGIGNYVTYRPFEGPGIRPRPYSIDFNVNEYTFAGTAGNRLGVNDVNPDSPHGVGFIWCTMLYNVWQSLIDKYGFNDDIFNDGLNPGNGLPPSDPESTNPNTDPSISGGNNIFNRLLIRGIQLQNAATFVEQRDAIIQADTELYGGVDTCIIWRAFAERGLGINAAGSDTSLGGETDDFNVPVDCGGILAAILEVEGVPDITNVPNGGDVTFTYTARNVSPNVAPNATLTVTLPDAFESITPADGGTASGNVVTWNFGNMAGNSTQVVTVTATLNSPVTTDVLFYDDMEGDESNWSTLSTIGQPGDNWIVKDDNPSTGSKSWFVPDPNNNSDQELRTATPVSIPQAGTGFAPGDVELVFFHNYNTERGFDAGALEYSTAPGGPWTDMEALFTENGYNDAIDAGDNPVLRPAGGNAFAGNSVGYVQSRALLNSLSGQDLYFRWRFSADVQTPAIGWWVDNVVIGKDVTFVNAEADFTADFAIVDADETEVLVLPAALPVELTDFNAQARDKDILLSWITETEVNNKGFNIERRAENETAFRTIGYAEGQGDSDVTVYYDFVDEDVELGLTYYYRLQQEDFDGRTEYSATRKARINTLENEVVLQPNPTRGQVSIVWSRAVGSYSVEVYDAAGKLISSQSNIQDTAYQFDLSDMPEQMYLVRITTAEDVITKRVVLNKR